MFFRNKKKIEKENIQKENIKEKCLHEEFYNDFNLQLGHARCIECGKVEVCSYFYSAKFARLEKRIEYLEEKLSVYAKM